MDILENPDYRVPVQPPAREGIAWLRGHVPRFAEGQTHVRRRRMAEEMLAVIDLRALRRPADHAAVPPLQAASRAYNAAIENLSSTTLLAA